MIILYILLALFVFVTCVIPFWVMFSLLMLIIPKYRPHIIVLNKLLLHMILGLFKLGGWIVISFVIVILWIYFLTWLICPASVWDSYHPFGAF